MRIARLDGVSLEYEERSSGGPLALIHLAPYADSFLPLMYQPQLAGYRLVRYRRRGYGGSSKSAGPIPDSAADLAGLLRVLVQSQRTVASMVDPLGYETTGLWTGAE
jgi:pimeloyl-ACP methyl ester carboxylesterase